MNILRSEKHNIFGMDVNKTSLSAFDTKRWIDEDGINTNAFGYNPLPTAEEMEALDEWLDGILGYNPPPQPTEAELERIDQWLEELFGG